MQSMLSGWKTSSRRSLYPLRRSNRACRIWPRTATTSLVPGWDDSSRDLERRLTDSYRRIAYEAGTGAIFSLTPDPGDEVVGPTSDLPLPPHEMRRLVAGLADPLA